MLACLFIGHHLSNIQIPDEHGAPCRLCVCALLAECSFHHWHTANEFPNLWLCTIYAIIMKALSAIFSSYMPTDFQYAMLIWYRYVFSVWRRHCAQNYVVTQYTQSANKNHAILHQTWDSTKTLCGPRHIHYGHLTGRLVAMPRKWRNNVDDSHIYTPDLFRPIYRAFGVMHTYNLRPSARCSPTWFHYIGNGQWANCICV